MAYILEILNSTGAKVAQLDEKECGVKIRRVINGEWTINITYPIPPSGQEEDKSALLWAANARGRVKNLDDVTDYQTFVLGKPVKSRGAGGAPCLQIQGTHISLVAMQNNLIKASYDFHGVTPAYALGIVLSHMSASVNPGVAYTVGSTGLELANLISVQISWENVLSGLQKILAACGATGAEWDISEAGSTVLLYTALGSANYVQIRTGRNLKSVQAARADKRIINKIYGIGGGQPENTIAGARHVVSSVVGQVVTVNHNKLVPENDSWNTNYKAKFVTGTLAGSSFAISDCSHSNDSLSGDTLTLVGVISSAVAGDKIVLTTSAGVEVSFIPAGSSQTANGIIEDVYKNSRYGNAINLVKTAFLDGTYVAGLCENWTKNGSPTVTENTNTVYIQNGSKSQKVIGVNTDDGIKQTLAVTANKYYRMKVNVYLAASNPAASIALFLDTYQQGDAQVSDTAAGKWVQWEGWFKCPLSAPVLKICQSGAQAATFYVDAVQFAECPIDEPQNYTSNCEQAELWFETFDQLMTVKDAPVEYKCTFIDLNKALPFDYPGEKISLGDTLVITDDELAIEAVSARVREINWNVFKPELTEHTITNI
jgi:hypothetical protein